MPPNSNNFPKGTTTIILYKTITYSKTNYSQQGPRHHVGAVSLPDLLVEDHNTCVIGRVMTWRVRVVKCHYHTTSSWITTIIITLTTTTLTHVVTWAAVTVVDDGVV